MAPKDFTLASAPAGTMVSSVSKRTSPKQLLLLKSDLVRGLHCLCCCAQAFSGCSEWGLLFAELCGLLTVVASPVVEPGV